MPNYKVYWSKRYHVSGIAKIEADSVTEAEEIVREHIGDYEGPMQYDPHGDTVSTLYEVETYKRGE